MSNLLVLVVEDDAPVRNLISTTLKTRGYEYLIARNGESAIMEASSHNPDVVLLDLGLPDIDGVDVIKKIRTWSEMPIIVISARAEDKDKIDALDAGADDYLTKPFSVEELLARLRVMGRRLSSMQPSGKSDSLFVNGDLKIDYAAGCAYLNGEELHLTPIEYKLLCLLSKNVGKVLTHTFITQKIWGASWESNVASLRVFMATLRKKIEQMNEAKTVSAYQKAAEAFQSIQGFKDADERISACQRKIEELKAKEEADRLERVRQARIAAKKANKRNAIIVFALVFLIMFLLFVVLPAIRIKVIKNDIIEAKCWWTETNFSASADYDYYYLKIVNKKEVIVEHYKYRAETNDQF